MRITFQVTISDSRRLTTYFAFCYPYSYNECQRRLAKLDDHYSISAQTSNPEAHEIYYYRFVLFSLQFCGVEVFFFPIVPRELLCHSLEGRRIDLITVTSWEGVTGEREARIPHLFPDEMAERCHVFKNKKVTCKRTDIQRDSRTRDFTHNIIVVICRWCL